MQRRPSWRQAPKFSVSKRSCFSYGKPPQHRCQRTSNMIFKMTTPAKLQKMRGISKKIPNFPHNILLSTPPSPSGTRLAALSHATHGAHSAAVYTKNLGKIKSFCGTIRKFRGTSQRFRQAPPSKCEKPQHTSEKGRDERGGEMAKPRLTCCTSPSKNVPLHLPAAVPPAAGIHWPPPAVGTPTHSHANHQT